MRSERWNTREEIRRRFSETSKKDVGAGPVLYYENGKKYTDDGEGHIAVIGRTGTGKTQCCSLPFMREILNKRESLVMIDPKRSPCSIPKDYQVYYIDFRVPRKSPTKVNPLSAPYRLFKSSDPDENDIAYSMVGEFWNAVYPINVHEDQFWPTSAANYAKGLTYGLFEYASESEINVNSIASMMEQSELSHTRSTLTSFGHTTMISAFHQSLPDSSLAKRFLSSYCSAPHETRASQHSVATNGISEHFSQSRGLMQMLSEDTLNILDLDVDRPFAIIIILPDETNLYDALCGILISQICQHLIRVAQERNGRLPIKTNILLEELGSIARSIPALPNLMVASRSRNIRLMLVLQSYDQLIDFYGKSKAETIYSCIGTTIGFSTNSWQTLTEWSQRCGEREVIKNGHLEKEPLITPTELASMPVGTALVMSGSYKFITQLPLYDEMYDKPDWKSKKITEAEPRIELKPFSFSELIEKAVISKSKEEANIQKKKDKKVPSQADKENNHEQGLVQTGEIHGIPSREELDDVIANIDATVAQIEAREKFIKEAEDAIKPHQVIITAYSGKAVDLARLISMKTNWSITDALKKIKHLPFKVGFTDKREAVRFVRLLLRFGADANLEE